MKIIYKKILTAGGKPLFVATRIENRGEGLTLCFDCDGVCRLDGKRYRIKDGECVIDTEALCGGSYAPTLISGGIACRCAEFILCDGRVSLPAPSGEELAALAVHLTEYEERLAAAERLLAELCELVRGKPLFEFT